MRLAYYAPNWHVPSSSENGIAAGFEQLGWTVNRFDERGATAKAIEGTQADLVLYTLGPDGMAEGVERAWHALGERVPTAGVHLDLFWGLARSERITAEPFFRLGRLFTADGGHDELWEAEGIPHTWMPPAVARDDCAIGVPRDEYMCDVLFVGSRHRYHPEWPWRQTLLDAVEARYGDRFLWLGAECDRSVRGIDLSNAIASSKVVLGDSLMLGPRYWSDRVVESMGRGGVLVHPLLPDESGFIAGRDYLAYEVGNVESVFAAIDAALRPTVREPMAWHGRFEVMRQHLWTDRVRSIILPTLAEDWQHLRDPESVLRMLARPGTTDVGVIDEVWRDDCYGLNGRDLAGKVVVDVGANIGAFAWRVANMGARVFAFEPEPANAAQMLAAFELPPSLGMASFYPVAIGASDGKATVEGSGGGAVAIPAPDGDVGMITLDAAMPPGQIDLLKLDCESCEFDALAASERLADVVEIVCETHEGNYGRPAVGDLVNLLTRTHRVEVSGRPMETGYLRAWRLE